MKRALFYSIVMCCLALVSISSRAKAHSFNLYGASLGGPGWEGFPVTLEPDLVTSNPGEKLDVTLTIYIHYEYNASGLVTTHDPPVPINTLAWWADFYAAHADGGWDRDFESTAEHDPAPDVEWHTCPSDPTGLTAAQGDYTLNSDGTLSISIPKAGGIGSNTILRIAACTFGDCEVHGDLPHPVGEYLVLGWNHPGTFVNFMGVDIDAEAGDIVVMDQLIAVSEPTPGFLLCRLPMLTVHWASTDIAQASRLRKNRLGKA